MSYIHDFLTTYLLAMLRFLPAVLLVPLSPLRWAPGLVRIALLMLLAWLATALMSAPVSLHGVAAWISAICAELLIGTAFGLAVMLPNAALHTAGWVLDVQAGSSAGVLFDPGSQNDTQAVFGTALMLVAIALFFVLDLHLQLYRMLAVSIQLAPLGRGGVQLQWDGLAGLLGQSFLLGFAVVLPAILGLLLVDVGVAYATRSMPQANVYFLALPLKLLAAVGLLMATLPFVPVLFARLFRDAYARVPALLGG